MFVALLTTAGHMDMFVRIDRENSTGVNLSKAPEVRKRELKSDKGVCDELQAERQKTASTYCSFCCSISKVYCSREWYG